MAKRIVFYSRAGENYFGGQYRWVTVGNTEKAAQMIAEAVGGELFKIQQKVPYAEDYETCIRQAKADQQIHARPEPETLPGSLEGYDEIYLGYPNYWGICPWRSTLSWKHLTGRAKPFALSVPMRAAA